MTHNVKESKIKKQLKKQENSEVLFHHRFSTSTPDEHRSCHPFSTKNTYSHNYIGVHNGVVRNPDELEKMHIEQGIEYVSKRTDGRFNDSEALVHDIAQYLECSVDKLTAKGSIAFIVVKLDENNKPRTLFWGRNTGNPLKIKKTSNSLTLSSVGEGEDVTPNQLHSYDYETKEYHSRPMTIPNAYQYNYGSTYNNYVKSTPKLFTKSVQTSFKMIEGSKTDIEDEILGGALGDYNTAAADTSVLIEGVNKELDKVENKYMENTNEQILEYYDKKYNKLFKYLQKLNEIYDYFLSAASSGDTTDYGWYDQQNLLDGTCK